MIEQSPATQASMVVHRTYRAPVEALWSLWTTKAGFESWWGPQGFRVAVHRIEPQIGGALEYEMIADTPDMIAAMQAMNQPASHATRGVYTECNPLKRIVLVHAIDFIAGSEPYDSTIEVDFYPDGVDTKMIVTIHPHRDPNWTQQAVAGFNSQLTKLDARYTHT